MSHKPLKTIFFMSSSNFVCHLIQELSNFENSLVWAGNILQEMKTTDRPCCSQSEQCNALCSYAEVRRWTGKLGVDCTT